MSTQELLQYNKGKGIERHHVASNHYLGFYFDVMTSKEGQRLFVHLDYYERPFSKIVYLQILEELYVLLDNLKKRDVEAIYAITDTSGNKMQFASMFGFEPIQAVTDKETKQEVQGWVLERKVS